MIESEDSIDEMCGISFRTVSGVIDLTSELPKDETTGEAKTSAGTAAKHPTFESVLLSLALPLLGKACDA
eukprot:406097-Pleurochrysis_carterae.AAC.1